MTKQNITQQERTRQNLLCKAERIRRYFWCLSIMVILPMVIGLFISSIYLSVILGSAIILYLGIIFHFAWKVAVYKNQYNVTTLYRHLYK